MDNEDTAYLKNLESWLYTAVAADILDAVNRRDQVLTNGIRPVGCDMRLVGRANTVLVSPVSEPPREPYKMLLEVLDSTQPGDVLVLAAGGRQDSALFGGLLATAALARGGRGAVIDGCTRDAREISRLGFPTFVRGNTPTDSLGRDDVTAYSVPVECGGVVVDPGDLVVADFDGVVVVPAALEHLVISKAREKVMGEGEVRAALAGGMPASEAFAKYGIL